jgi:membrane protein implicated in regulation of membrane protease activity
MPAGRVRVRGELWSALCPSHARAGDAVVVESVDGLTLQVRAATG